MLKTMKIWRWPLHWQILVGLVIGAVAGWSLGIWAVNRIPSETEPGQAGMVAAAIAMDTWAYLLLHLVGDLFLRGLQLIIVPLVVSSIVLAVVNLGSGSDFGRLGGKTLLYYMATSLIAILIGLTLVNLVAPGIGDDGRGILVGRDLSAFEADQSVVEQRTEGKGLTDFLDVFRSMIPSNFFAAATDNGQLLGLIVVALAVGFFLARLTTESKPRLVGLTQGIYDITLSITDLVLRLAPIGILGLVAATVAEQHSRLAPDDRFGDFATGIGKFALIAFLALLTHLIITMPLILSLIARVNPLRHYKAMAPALITAFSTASSSATLPVTMECVEKRAGVSNRTASFVLPLGATVNMDGTALYECAAAIFICQAFGVDLSFAQQFLIVITALLTSIGVAGVPAASLVAIVVILNAVEAGLPPGTLPAGASLVAGLGLLMVFDRPLDMCRTAVNIFSDSVGAVMVAKTEGETGVLAPGTVAEGDAQIASVIDSG